MANRETHIPKIRYVFAHQIGSGERLFDIRVPEGIGGGGFAHIFLTIYQNP
jgi:hypothetical protein